MSFVFTIEKFMLFIDKYWMYIPDKDIKHAKILYANASATDFIIFTPRFLYEDICMQHLHEASFTIKYQTLTTDQGIQYKLCAIGDEYPPDAPFDTTNLVSIEGYNIYQNSIYMSSNAVIAFAFNDFKPVVIQIQNFFGCRFSKHTPYPKPASR